MHVFVHVVLKSRIHAKGLAICMRVEVRVEYFYTSNEETRHFSGKEMSISVTKNIICVFDIRWEKIKSKKSIQKLIYIYSM